MVNGSKLVKRLTISESGEKKGFAYRKYTDSVIGYISKFEAENGKTKVNGKRFRKIL